MTDSQREEAEKQRQKSKINKNKTRNDKSQIELYNLDAEKPGTGVVYTEPIRKAKLDIIQHDNRNITLSLAATRGKLNITGTHAPHAHDSAQEKHKHYTTLREIANAHGKHNIHVIVGDFNARLITQLPEESGFVGPHVFNPEGKRLSDLPAKQMENRELFVEFLAGKDYTVASTFFTKTTANLITFRNARTVEFAPPFSSDRFAQIGHILINQK